MNFDPYFYLIILRYFHFLSLSLYTIQSPPSKDLFPRDEYWKEWVKWLFIKRIFNRFQYRPVRLSLRPELTSNDALSDVRRTGTDVEIIYNIKRCKYFDTGLVRLLYDSLERLDPEFGVKGSR